MKVYKSPIITYKFPILLIGNLTVKNILTVSENIAIEGDNIFDDSEFDL